MIHVKNLHCYNSSVYNIMSNPRDFQRQVTNNVLPEKSRPSFKSGDYISIMGIASLVFCGNYLTGLHMLPYS